MAYNKAKHIEAAQKFLHQGKTAQAISEYQAVLKHEPKDQVTLMTVGDLYVRQGETFEALEYFERLAQLFLSDGFVTKAIAIYKKIAKLAPEQNRPVERLAELYVQQGVLSEARPIYLQLAEGHQRAGRHPQAAVLLRKLLDAEPDNLRVQTRLAELSLAMGERGDAAEAYRNAGEQNYRRGDHAEAIRFADLALDADPADRKAATLKARALSRSGKTLEAVALLKSLPDLESGEESALFLLDLYLENGDRDAAADLAKATFARNPKKFALAHRVAAALLEAGDTDGALALIDLIRETMTDSGEHEALSQFLYRTIESAPAKLEPREWLVELYGRISDSFHLPEALADLAAAYENAGQHDRARKVYEQILERDPENEKVRVKLGLSAGPAPGDSSAAEAESAQVVFAEAPPPAPPKSNELPLDDETNAFLTQTLTDVDLFSSYGLTEKAIDLLEVVLQRVPRHTPTIERLLDLYLGAGDERRTAELASQLEQLHKKYGNSAASDRFGELRRRFERAARLNPPEAVEAVAAPHAVAEFNVPLVEAATPPEPQPISFRVEEPVAASQDAAGDPAVHEVDLSDEWAELAASLNEAADTNPQSHPVAEEAATEQRDEIAAALAPAQTVDDLPAGAQAAGKTSEAADVTEYMLELDPLPAENGNRAKVSNGSDFLQSLSGELDDALSRLAPVEAAGGTTLVAAASSAPAAFDVPAKPPASSSAPAPACPPAPPLPPGPLSDVFDQFRAELGEMHAEDEDLETHYNLGIAYREMGLLDEAISEFQKVAKASHLGHAFRYAMQCCTLLGLAFMEKGQPSIAAMWYERALETPGLDQESVLALRYDLGVAQDLAGDTAAARKSFSQVYGMNIDYRDVAERLGALGKGS